MPYHKRPQCYKAEIYSPTLKRRVEFFMSNNIVEDINLSQKEEADEWLVLNEIKKHFRILEEN
jgi:hypothetical protein